MRQDIDPQATPDSKAASPHIEESSGAGPTTPRPLPRIYLIRHGETEWSLSGQHTGSTDIPLTAHGEEEARRMAPYLQGISFTRVLTSPLQRARQTAVLVGLGVTAEVHPDLSEWNYGKYEGRKSAEIHAERPDWNLFQDGCPGGESPSQVSDRADRLIAYLRTLEGNVALCAHGHIGSVLAVRWIGLNVAEGEHFPLSTATLSILDDVPRHPGVPVIALWNATPHEAPKGKPH